MKTSKKKLQETLWKLCVEYIRKRDNMTCQWCGKKVKGSDAHTSHVIPRSHGNTLKYDSRNLKLLCYHCHMNKWHKNPLEAAQWYEKKYPDNHKTLMWEKDKKIEVDNKYLERVILEYKEMIRLVK